MGRKAKSSGAGAVFNPNPGAEIIRNLISFRSRKPPPHPVTLELSLYSLRLYDISLHRCFIVSTLGQEFFSLYGGLTSKRQKVPFFICLPFFTILSDLQAVKSILKSKIWRFQWYIILVLLIAHCLLVGCTVLLIFSVFWSRKRISRRKKVHLK